MDFLYKKHPKGTYEYAGYKKIVDTCVMIVFFLLALGLYVTGILTTGSKRNLLTIVAVLGLLPACKMVVSVIMSLRVHPCETGVRDEIDAHVGILCGQYNMYFTSYDKNYLLTHMVVYGRNIIGLSSGKGFDEKEFTAHISDLARKEGIKDLFVKIFDDKDKYIKRLDELNASEGTETEADAILASLIHNVTL